MLFIIIIDCVDIKVRFIFMVTVKETIVGKIVLFGVMYAIVHSWTPWRLTFWMITLN